MSSLQDGAASRTAAAQQGDAEALVDGKTDLPRPVSFSRGRKHHTKGSSLRQVWCALAANLGTVNTGMAFGFSAVALPMMQDSSTSIIPPVNDAEKSWIASMSAVSTPLGCLVSGWLMDRIGRKRTLVVTQVPLVAGWLVTGQATSLLHVYLGRLLVGLGSGMVGAPARVYTAEATQPHLRGSLAAIASIGVSMGVLVEYLVGSLVGWKTLALISSLVPGLGLLLALVLPESPQWLMTVGRREESKRALLKLRGSTCDIDHEVTEMVSFADKNNLRRATMKEQLVAVTKPAALRPFVVLTLYFLIYQFSGVNPVTFYAVTIFKESGTELDGNVATVVLGVVRVLFTVVGCLLMRRCGRRDLTFISSIGCGVTMLTLGTYMYLMQARSHEGLQPVLTWVPLASMLTFIAVSTIGYLVVPWVMIGEVYPTQVRGLVGGLTTCCGHFFVFIVVKTFPLLQESISKHGVFWLYGSISCLGTIFFYLCLPETKGRSLQEIEDYFSGRTKTLGSTRSIAAS